MKNSKRTLLVLLVTALSSPLWIPLPSSEASAEAWVYRDMGACSSTYDSLGDVALGDGDSDNRSEVYFCGLVYLYRYSRNGANWSVENIGTPFPGSYSSADALCIADGDSDGITEVYVSGQKNYQPTLSYLWKDGPGWKAGYVCWLPYSCTDMACGDGDNDGQKEIFLAGRNGHVYGYSFSGKCLTDVGNSTERMWSVEIADGDNDGRNEVYAACADSHMYRFNWTGSAWAQTDMGFRELSAYGICAVAVADVDQDSRNEVYGVSQFNSTLWRYDFIPASGTWRVLGIGTLMPGSSAYCMAIGDICSSGWERIYVGLWDPKNWTNRIYEVSWNASNGWVSSVFDEPGAICHGLDIGNLAPDYREVELFAALDDGHGREYCHDRIPPGNPVLSSDTHPKPGKWYRIWNVVVRWTDNGSDVSGIQGYSYLWDRDPASIPDDELDCRYTIRSLRCYLADGGDWYFHIRAVDGSSNWNRTASHFGPVRIDQNPPANVTVMINGGNASANDSVVTLSLGADDPEPGSGLDSMAFSNDGYCWSHWEPFAPVRPGWDLSDPQFGGVAECNPKSVVARVRDVAGNELPEDMYAMDDIIVDRMAPQGLGVQINGGAGFAKSADVVLGLSGLDPEPSGGTLEMSFSNDNASWSDWEPFAASKAWTLAEGAGGSAGNGFRTVWFRLRDAVGNPAGPVSDSIFLDTVGPVVGFLMINDDSPWTSCAVVNLTWNALDDGPSSGLDKIQLSSNAVDWEFRDISSDMREWDLGTGDGLKTVFARASDVAGNVGDTVNVSVVLDTAGPTAAVSEIPGPVTDIHFTVQWDGKDATSGILSYNVQYRNVSANSWWLDLLTGTNQKSTLFSGSDGSSYRFRVRARDHAGNLGQFSEIGQAVKIDVPPPNITIEAPAPGTVVEGRFRVSGRASQPFANRTILSIEVQIDDEHWLIANGTYDWSRAIDSWGLSNGKHVVRARAFDGTKYSAEASKEFSVRNPETTPHREEPLSGTAAWIALIVCAAVAMLFILIGLRRKKGGAR
jgi:hypothetical protein